MNKVIRILAIGDSLTAGYYDSGRSNHSYAIHLAELLSSSPTPVEIDEKGISGEKVVPSMARRLQRLLSKSDSSPHDWIIILGGTNDLGYRGSAETVFHQGLKPMYEMVLDSSGKTCRLVVMTVIETGFALPDNRDDKPRQDLNHLIRDYSTNHTERDRIYLVDLDKDIPYHGLQGSRERALIWDDLVHLKPAGYDRMATSIFQAIQKDILQQ